MNKTVALSHDWLNGMRGGEKCLELMCELFPGAPIYTLFCQKEKISVTLKQHPIYTSLLQYFPFVFSRYRYYLPFFPMAVESMNLKDHDLIISTTHCVAKGIKKNKGAVHICYCFTPMRYAWGFFEEYFGRRARLSQGAINYLMHYLRQWDKVASDGVDHFVAISNHVKNRIHEHYGREADVIYPPVDIDFYTSDVNTQVEDFYLVVSALVPYKRVDVAIGAFNQTGKKLLVIGEGPERSRLEKMSEKNIHFMGWQPNEVLRDMYRKTKALIFPGEEDFGIVPLEVQACGRFVIAYAKGGALETVKENETGLFFKECSADSLLEALGRFEKTSLGSQESRANSLRFSRDRFKEEFKNFIETKTSYTCAGYK